MIIFLVALVFPSACLCVCVWIDNQKLATKRQQRDRKKKRDNSTKFELLSWLKPPNFETDCNKCTTTTTTTLMCVRPSEIQMAQCCHLLSSKVAQQKCNTQTIRTTKKVAFSSYLSFLSASNAKLGFSTSLTMIIQLAAHKLEHEKGKTWQI